METLMTDLRLGVRTLAKSPGFTTVVVVTLALGIGANTAIFSVVNAVLLQPLPYPEPERLVRVWSAFPEDGSMRGPTSPLDLEDWREGNDVFDAIAGFPRVPLSGYVLTGGETPVEIPTAFVTEGFFETLGVAALHGRALGRADHIEGRNTVVVVSHGAWERRFGSDPTLVGDTISLSGQRFEVVGVMPRSFAYPSDRTEIWVPMSLIPDSGVPRRRFIRWLDVVARLRPGVSMDQARAAMTTIARRLASEYPDSNERLTRVTLRPLRAETVGDVQASLWTLFGAVGFVLLIACANIANLVLGRAEGRRRDVALRIALGAGRARLVRGILTENVILSLLGGALGLFVGMRGADLLVAMAPGDVPLLSTVTLDGSVLLFTALLSIATGIAFGILPAVRMAGADPHRYLKEGGRGGGHFRAALLVAEVALVVLLATGAGLLIHSYARLFRVDPGVDPSKVLTVGLTAQSYKYPERADYVGFFDRVMERVRALPGIESVGIVRPIPLATDTFRGEGVTFSIPGRPMPPRGQEPEAVMRFVSPGYFRTMRIPLLAGRDFRKSDDAGKPLVAILDQTTAQLYWPGEDPVGESILLGETPVSVIGVVGAVQQRSLAEPPNPALYVSYRQVSRVGMTLVVRTKSDPLAAIGAVQRAIWEVDPDQPIKQISSMEQVVASSAAGPRFSMTLLTVFAGLALALAAVGIYGVVSYTVSQQTREIGIRIAVGAAPHRIRGSVVGQTMALAAVGITTGIGGAFVLTQFMESLLFRVTARDPLSLFAASGLIAIVSWAAAQLPATRASRVDPIIALKYE